MTTAKMKKTLIALNVHREQNSQYPLDQKLNSILQLLRHKSIPSLDQSQLLEE